MKKIVLLAIAAYLFITLAKTPALMVVSQFKNEIRPLALTHVSGSIWEGSAQANYHGLKLGEYQWKLSALTLLSGHLSTELKQKDSSSSIKIYTPLWNTNLIKSLFMDIKLSDFRHVNPLLSSINSTLRGQINNLNVLSCDGINGELSLSKLTFSGINFGTFRGKPECSGNRHQLKFNNSDSDIQIQGSITADVSGQYRIIATLQTNNPNIKNQLSPLLGSSPNGVYQLDYSGSP